MTQETTPWDAGAPGRFHAELRDVAEGLTHIAQQGDAIQAGDLLNGMLMAFREVTLGDGVAVQLYAFLDAVGEIARAK